jgi:aspartate/methionine/tyrosine aminotransferase
MYSSRFHWDLRPNRLTEMLREKRRAGVPVLDLTQSNPTHAGLEYSPEIVQSLADERALSYDPAPAGSPEARRTVSAHYQLRGFQVDLERVLLTASTSEAYAYLFKLLCDPGDEVLVPRPSYPLFEFLADMENVKVRQYPLRYHGEWSIDSEALKQSITDRTRAIIVVNPNNPTGSYLKHSELQFLESLGLPLISDEVFADYNLTQDPARVYSVVDVAGGLAFAMSGLSKVAGLPQMKLGWIVTNSSEAMERLEWIADTYLSVSTPVQYAAGRLLDLGDRVQRQIRLRCGQNLKFAREALDGSAADVLHVEGGWCAPIKMPRIRSEEEWTLELLSKQEVLLQPGFFFDFESEAFLVASLLTPPEVFEEGIRRLRASLA